MTVKKTTTVPVQGGTATKMTAKALADKAIRELGSDPAALHIVVQLVEFMAERSRSCRR